MIARWLAVFAPVAYGCLGFPCLCGGPLQTAFNLACGGQLAAALLLELCPSCAWSTFLLRISLLCNLAAASVVSYRWCFGFVSWALSALAVVTFQVTTAMRVRGFVHIAVACLVLLLSFVNSVDVTSECVADEDEFERATQAFFGLSGALVVAVIGGFGVTDFRSSALARRLTTLKALISAPLSDFEARRAAVDYADEDLSVKAVVPIFEGVTLSKRIGRGAFGQVFYGLWNDRAVAVKIVARLPEGNRRKSLLEEPRIAMTLNHPGLVATYQCGVVLHNGEQETLSCAEGNGSASSWSWSSKGLLEVTPESVMEIWMMQEYCDRGTFNDICMEPRRAADQLLDACDMLLDIAQAGAYLHSRGLIHADLTGSNVLLKSDAQSAKGFVCKVTDFGLTRMLSAGSSETIASMMGTVTHMPPEHFNLDGTARLTRAADVYAAGVLLWQAIQGEQPFDGVHPSNVVLFVSEGRRLELDDEAPEPLRELYSRCVATSADDRPSFSEVASMLEAYRDEHLLIQSF